MNVITAILQIIGGSLSGHVHGESVYVGGFVRSRGRGSRGGDVIDEGIVVGRDWSGVICRISEGSSKGLIRGGHGGLLVRGRP